MPRQTIKRIHVNQHVVKSNAKNDEHKPIFTVKCSNRNHYGHTVKIQGPSEVVYPGKTLSCGAKAWIETTAPVEVWVTSGPDSEYMTAREP